MALRITPDTPIADGLRKTALLLVERARADLARTDDRADGVHEARKTFKKVRAIARLARASLGGAWRAEDRFWRDLGRALSDERDAEAVIEAFDALIIDGEAPDFRAVRDVLARRRVVPFPKADTDAKALAAELAAAAERVRGWPLPDRFGAVAEGLEAGYRRARRRGRRAVAEPCVATLHAWRRAVKQHAVQVRLFKDMAVGPVGAHLALVDQLSDRLGDDHDLELLRVLLSGEEAAWASPQVQDELLARMARRHALLRRGAFSLGERVFAERPPAFRRRLRRYWRAFVRDTVGERAEPRRAPPAEDPSAATGS